MKPKDTFLYAPFLGWFWGLPGALRKDTLTPYFLTWLITMPFLGWFLALYFAIGIDPWVMLLRLRTWP